MSILICVQINRKKNHFMFAMYIADTGQQISDKEKVAIYVHEHFGTSKRFCEDDKKDIRKFLLKQIRQNKDEVDGGLHRQDSMETDSNFDDLLQKDIENDLLKRVYELLMKTQNKDGDNAAPCEMPQEFNIDMIEDKVNELNGKVTQLEGQIEECYNVIGVENKNVPLQELVQTLAKDQQKALKLQQDLDNLEKHRKAMDIKLEVTQAELSRKVKEMASIEHENEKLYLQKKELKDKCEKLEKIHLKHMEKQQTLMALKSMVSELRPQTGKSMKESINFKYDLVDGHCENVHDKHDKPKMRLSLPRIRGSHRQAADHLHHEHPKHIKKIQHPSITKAKEVYEHPWK